MVGFSYQSPPGSIEYTNH